MWRNHRPAFIAELNARRREVWGTQVDRLLHLLPRAVDVLEAELEGDQPLRAAVHLLRAVRLYGTDLRPLGPTNPVDVEYQMQAEKTNRLLQGLGAG